MKFAPPSEIRPVNLILNPNMSLLKPPGGPVKNNHKDLLVIQLFFQPDDGSIQILGTQD